MAGSDKEQLWTEIDWISDNLSLGNTLIDRFLEKIARFVEAEGALMRLHLDGSGVIYLEHRVGTIPDGLARLHRLEGDPLARQAAETGEVLQAFPAPGDLRWKRVLPEAAEGRRPEAVLVAPFAERGLKGTIELFRYRAEPFAERDKNAVELFAAQLGASLSSARGIAIEERRVAELTTLMNLTEVVGSSLEPAEVRRAAIEAATDLMGCEAASLILLDEQKNELFFDVALGDKAPEVQRIRLRADEGVAGWVVKNDKPYLDNRLQDDEVHSHRVDDSVGFETREMLAVPLRFRGKVLGCLQALNTIDRAGFAEEEIEIFQALANQVAVAVANAKLFEELKLHMEQIARQQEQLIQSEKLSAMGQLSAGVAHEIRSPLSAISGYAQLLRKRYADNKDMEKALRVIEDATSHINRIVNGLLDFSRKEEPHLEPISIHEALEKTLLLAEHTLSRYRKVEVVKAFAKELPPVVADMRQMQQVFLNFMINAAQAMPDGGRLTIETSTEPAPGDESRLGRVVVLFKDTGVGIPPDVQDKIFQPFFTSGKEGGTGLGLSICRSIVQKHRGSITFTSEVGRGTTFRVQLPVDRTGPSA